MISGAGGDLLKKATKLRRNLKGRQNNRNGEMSKVQSSAREGTSVAKHEMSQQKSKQQSGDSAEVSKDV